MDGVGDDFVRVVRRSLPRQQDGRAGHGVGVDVPGRAGPVLRHHHDEARRGQDGALLVLGLALVNGVVLWDDLVYHQFTTKSSEERKTELSTRNEVPPRMGILFRVCRVYLFLAISRG